MSTAATALVIDHDDRNIVADRPANVPSAMTPMDMLDRAIASGAGIDVLEKLMALQERYEKNQGRKAFDNAMAAAKAEIPVIFKSRTVDFTSAKGRTHYRYEDLAEVAKTVTPILGKYGLSYRFRTSSAANEPVTVTCIVSHRDGHSEENTLVGPRDDSGNKNSLQQIGSTLSYLQRMTLKASLGLAASDDDDGRLSGNADSGPISADQVETIRREITDTATEEASFLKWLDAPSIEEIPAIHMTKIMQSFAAKRRRMAS